MVYPDKSFKPTPINELIEKFDKEINQFMENQKKLSLLTHKQMDSLVVFNILSL